MSNVKDTNDSGVPEFRMEFDAKLVQLGFEVQTTEKDGKKILHPETRMKMYPQRTAYVTLNPKITGLILRQLTDTEKLRGVVYVRTGDGEIVQDPAQWPATWNRMCCTRTTSSPIMGSL